MNNETALIVALVVAVLVIALGFGFSQTVLNSANESILGGKNGQGIVGCDPAKEEDNCPVKTEDTSYKIEEKVNSVTA